MEKRNQRLWHAGHWMAWLGGILIALTPFAQAWSIPMGEYPMPVRLWPGNLIVELIVAGGLAVVGGTFGGYWWQQRLGGRWGGFDLLAWGLAGWLGWLAQPIHGLGVVALLGVAAVSWLRANWGRMRAGAGVAPDTSVPWNGVLFGLILILSVVSDCSVVGQAEGGAPAALGLVVARVLTQVVIVSLAWFVLHQFLRWSPAGARWIGALGLGLTLLLLGAEIGMRKLWGKGLVMFFGELAVGGKFDLLRVLEGGGIKLSAANMLGLLAAVALVCALMIGSARLSKGMGLRLRPWVLLLVALGAWLPLMAEQGSESMWNSRAGRWWQRRSCLIHLCPEKFAAGEYVPGLASFSVQFRAPQPLAELSVRRRPDVFWFIVETLRGDGVTAEVMPFVSHWRDSECQPVGASLAASNATHLSWYAMLSGRPPVFWEQDRQKQKPAPLLQLLKGAGYRNEVRSAAIFNYAEMDTTNFGHGEATDVLLSFSPDNPEWPPGIGERDLRVMDLWRKSVLANPAGSGFRLVAIESPHYPYNWGSSFTPPFADYAQTSWFPLHPNPQDIQRVKNRYWNSLAWVDTLVRDYVGFLKEHGRYDDAMIILTGDHGEEFQEHGTWFHASGLTPEQTAVPVIIKWPKALGRGEPVAQASHLDIMPSILDALGCPETQWRGAAGHSLRQGGELTSLVMTHLASQNGEGMLWRRNGYEAAFAWHKIWVPGLPTRLWLERISGPQGPLDFDSAAAAEAALRGYFPDAVRRWFSTFERDKSAD
jgi:hypothetical protein